MPSACAGVHGSLRAHWLPHPRHANTCSPSYRDCVGAQSHSWRHAETLSTSLVWGTVPTARMTAFVKGRVQGVGFRWWTRARALELGLTGSATNLADGRVEVVAEGDEQACRRLLELLPKGPGQVEFVAERWGPPRGAEGFHER